MRSPENIEVSEIMGQAEFLWRQANKVLGDPKNPDPLRASEDEPKWRQVLKVDLTLPPSYHVPAEDLEVFNEFITGKIDEATDVKQRVRSGSWTGKDLGNPRLTRDPYGEDGKPAREASEIMGYTNTLVFNWNNQESLRIIQDEQGGSRTLKAVNVSLQGPTISFSPS